MLKKIVFLLAVLLAAPLSLQAQGTLPDGNYRLAMISNPGIESAMVIIKVETRDGKQTGTLLASPPPPPQSRIPPITMKSFSSEGGTVVITLSNGYKFTSATAGPEKSLLGSMGTDTFFYRAKLTPTDKTTLDQENRIVRLKVPEAYTKATSLNTKPMQLQFQWQNEKDADKKKTLRDQVNAARTEADEKAPELFKEVVDKHADTLAALDASNSLLAVAAKIKLSTDDATRLIKIIETQAKPYGPAYSNYILLQAANTLLRNKGFESVAANVLEPLYNRLSDKLPASQQQPLLTAYAQALKAGSNPAVLKTVEARLEKLEGELDREYHATVPPFKPTKFAGRKEADANQVVVMELFTGAQCPPCVAADVAFDALEKAYDHKDLVLIQYHMHIPGPDPLTNPDTVARFDYYRKHFASDIRGTPSTLFNGKPQAGGGGGMANAESKYKQYADIINPMLEKATPVKMSGTASRNGDKLDIHVDVYGVEGGDELRLRLLVVEESIKYVGSNKLRFHHQVVRAMPGGPSGVVVNNKNFKHQASADVSKIRSELNKYLDDYAANTRAFPYPQRPLDMKNLKVIALVQNDKTAEIIQACQLDVTGKVAAR